jgi:hypothetical protein
MAQSAISTPNLYPLPTPKPGHRFVPAKVGRSNATSVIVLIEDPMWCTEDHLGEPVRDVSDVMHRGEPDGLSVPSFAFAPYPHQLYAQIESDPVATDPRLKAAHVMIEDGGGNNQAVLTPEMVDALADEVISFASYLRSLARQVRQANQVTGDSDPDMYEALRRVREGGVA